LKVFALYTIWVVFALAFVPRIVSGWPVYSFFGIAAIVALTIRIVLQAASQQDHGRDSLTFANGLPPITARAFSAGFFGAVDRSYANMVNASKTDYCRPI